MPTLWKSFQNYTPSTNVVLNKAISSKSVLKKGSKGKAEFQTDERRFNTSIKADTSHVIGETSVVSSRHNNNIYNTQVSRHQKTTPDNKMSTI